MLSMLTALIFVVSSGYNADNVEVVDSIDVLYVEYKTVIEPRLVHLSDAAKELVQPGAKFEFHDLSLLLSCFDEVEAHVDTPTQAWVGVVTRRWAYGKVVYEHYSWLVNDDDVVLLDPESRISVFPPGRGGRGAMGWVYNVNRQRQIFVTEFTEYTLTAVSDELKKKRPRPPRVQLKSEWASVMCSRQLVTAQEWQLVIAGHARQYIRRILHNAAGLGGGAHLSGAEAFRLMCHAWRDCVCAGKQGEKEKNVCYRAADKVCVRIDGHFFPTKSFAAGFSKVAEEWAAPSSGSARREWIAEMKAWFATRAGQEAAVMLAAGIRLEKFVTENPDFGNCLRVDAAAWVMRLTVLPRPVLCLGHGPFAHGPTCAVEGVVK
jgi:hypothetical protein